MDFSGNLPMIAGVGLAVGLVLVITKTKAGNDVATGAVARADPTLVSASVAMNTAALGAQTQLSAISEKLGEAQLAADTHNQAAFYSYLENHDNNNTQIQNTVAVTNAGVTAAIIAAGSAVAIDQSNNAARTAQVQINAGATIVQSNNARKIAKYQAKGNLISGIVGSVGKVAQAALPVGGF